MPLLLKEESLSQLMRDFYVLTGIRIILFDAECEKILAYPEDEAMFCACMRKNPDFDRRCRTSDAHSFKVCKKTGEITVFKCHAGLVEATAPIVENRRIIGYLMLGQVTDSEDREVFLADMRALCEGYGVRIPSHMITCIKRRSEEQIRAASKILEACTAYVRMREMVKPSGKRLSDALDAYLDAHISEPMTVSVLCKALSVSRTRLYEALGESYDGGIASYVRERRLLRARELILTGELSVSEIADAVGFSDYNYFLRAFKKRYGVSPKTLRRTQGTV